MQSDKEMSPINEETSKVQEDSNVSPIDANMRLPEDLRIQLESMQVENSVFTNERVHQMAVYSALKRENKRYCSHCQKFKVF